MKLLLPLFSFFLILFFSTTNSTPFSCTTKSPCRSLIGYTSPNATTLLQIKTLFNVKSIHALVSTNNLPPSTTSSYQVPPNSTTRISFTCNCTANGTGVPSRPPTYEVKAGDGLDYIARTVFGGLVTYQEIAAFSNVADPNLIVVGQQLKIPLPCGCDEVDGMKVMHYGLVVPMGATLGGIGDNLGVDEKVLLKVNGLKDPKELKAGQVLDVPLKDGVQPTGGSNGSFSNGVPMSQPTGGSNGSFNHGGLLIFLETMLILLACVL